MDVTDLPFNRHLGIGVAPDGAVTLPAGPLHHNHLGTVHAAALFAVAEAASGAWVIAHLAAHLTDTLAMTRSASIQYKKPATTALRASVARSSATPEELLAQLAARGLARVTLDVHVESDAVLVATAAFEWIFQRAKR